MKRHKLNAAAPALLAALTNLIERGLIEDKCGDHYLEAVEAVGKVRGEKWAEQWEVQNLEFR